MGTRKNHTWAFQRADMCEKGVDWTQYNPTLVPDILATYVSSGPSLPGTSYRSKVSVIFCANRDAIYHAYVVSVQKRLRKFGRLATVRCYFTER
jgi:hypothetical protein